MGYMEKIEYFAALALLKKAGQDPETIVDAGSYLLTTREISPVFRSGMYLTAGVDGIANYLRATGSLQEADPDVVEACLKLVKGDLLSILVSNHIYLLC